jgi:hypothetical protein
MSGCQSDLRDAPHTDDLAQVSLDQVYHLIWHCVHGNLDMQRVLDAY